MTAENDRMTVLATFGFLAMFYLGSVFLQMSTWGWAWTFDAANTERTLAYSLVLRTIGGLISSIVFVLAFVRSRWRKLRGSLAWVLAFGVAIVVVIDNLYFQSIAFTSRAMVWLVAAAIVGLHLFGAIIAQRRMIE